jgi:hypothetical protein
MSDTNLSPKDISSVASQAVSCSVDCIAVGSGW